MPRLHALPEWSLRPRLLRPRCGTDPEYTDLDRKAECPVKYGVLLIDSYGAIKSHPLVACRHVCLELVYFS
jgi:hypothetical protein